MNLVQLKPNMQKNALLEFIIALVHFMLHYFLHLSYKLQADVHFLM